MSRRTKVILADTPPSQSVPTFTGVAFLASVPNKGVHDPAAGPCRSMAAVEKRYGTRQTFSVFYDWAELFFRDGGRELWVSPVRGPNPVAASLNIPGTGTTLVATATSVGDWANGATGGYTVEVVNGPVNGATHRQLIVRYGGVEVGRTVEFNDRVQVDGAIVDEVKFTLGGGSGLPTVAAAANLTSGTLDRTNITQTQVSAALAALSADLGPGQVASPDWVTEAASEALLAHARERNRWALCDTADTTSKSTLLTAVNLVQGHADGDHGQMIAPWVTIRGTGGSSTQRSVPGSAFVAAKANQTDSTDGPNQAPAGRWGRATSSLVTGVKASYSDADAAELEDAGVNLIISRYELVQFDGNRSLVEPLGPERQWLQASNCRFRMALTAELVAAGENFEHAQLVPATFAQYGTALTQVMQRRQGSLFPALDGSDPGFVVDTDEDVNTPETIEARQLNAQVGFRPAKGADLLEIRLSMVGIGDPAA